MKPPSREWIDWIRFLLGGVILVSEVVVNRGGIRAEALGAVAMCWFYGALRDSDRTRNLPRHLVDGPQ